METAGLGRTGIPVTPLGYGAMELRVPKNHENAEEILNTVLDSGIRYIDTSPDYGMSEELIGRYIGHRRKEYSLATKCACNLSGEGPAHIFTRSQFEKNLHESMRRLKTEHLELLQIHCVTPADLPGRQNDDAVRYLEELKKTGVVDAIGISFKNGSLGQEMYPTKHQEAYTMEMMSWGVFDTVQMVWGPLTRVSEKEIGILSAEGYGIIARGVLKKYFPEDERRLERARLFELCEEGETVPELLLRYALSNPHVSVRIVGSADPQHIRQNALAAEKGKLPENMLKEIDRRLSPDQEKGRDQTVKTVLNVEGMMCHNCERHVNEAIAKAFEVESVESDCRTNTTVVVSKAPLDKEKLSKVIADADYELKGITEES